MQRVLAPDAGLAGELTSTCSRSYIDMAASISKSGRARFCACVVRCCARRARLTCLRSCADVLGSGPASSTESPPWLGASMDSLSPGSPIGSSDSGPRPLAAAAAVRCSGVAAAAACRRTGLVSEEPKDCRLAVASAWLIRTQTAGCCCRCLLLRCDWCSCLHGAFQETAGWRWCCPA